jgi:PAS domain S-box-containing protein/putative nucleotidyltransferase with HDIG domain
MEVSKPSPQPTDERAQQYIERFQQELEELRRERAVLRESEEVFRTITEGSLVGAYLFQDEKYIYVNPALAKLFGYTPDELMGRLGPLDLAHPADRSLVEENIRRRLSGEVEAIRYTARGIRKDGKVIYTEIFGRRIEFRGRAAIVGTLVDITERVQALEALRESEERYRAVVDAAQDAIVTINSKAEIITWNNGAEKIYGYTADEILGKPLFAIMPERFHEAFKKAFERAVSTGKSTWVGKVTEIVGFRKDGSKFPAEMSLAVWEHKGETFFTAIVRDITARKRTLEQLQLALEGAIYALEAAIEMRDPYTSGHQRRVAELSRAIAQEMGLPEDRVEGIYIGALMHDIGKISVPAEILAKPRRLDDAELNLVQAHTMVGYEILKKVEFPWPVAEMALQHHERLDGSGYPQGLKGDEITLEARILGVADVVEAMASHRPYRPARGVDEALEEISQNRGILYDPEVVDACLKLFTEKGFKLE